MCGHAAKAERRSFVDRLWGLRPYCPEPVGTADNLRDACGCNDPWHVAGT